MAKPRIFISSTFFDLKQVRSSLEAFILGLGFDPVLSEKGNITYSPDVPLDESCYREAQSCDVFVLVVGGRYGSQASGDREPESKGFYDKYESITRKEYESALERDIPIYILIEKSVYSEYETFKRNRENQTIKYAYVDSVNVFAFIDYVLNRPRNNPVYHFELSSEIETWLREQWAGLFRELIRTRADRIQISSLSDQVTDLRNVSTTLKRYLEEVVARVGNKEQAKEIIDEEKARLSDARELNELAKLGAIRSLKRNWDTPIETARSVFAEATSFEDLARRIEQLTKGLSNQIKADFLVDFWKENPDMASTMNEVRDVLHLPSLKFLEEANQEQVVTTKSARKRPKDSDE